MSGAPPGRSAKAATAPSGPRWIPVLMIGRSARVMLPSEAGPIDARMPDGRRVDLFDLTDYLAAKYRRLFVVDLQGTEHNRPQLDYLQEITRDTDVWVDAGTLSGDGVIDILVAGARRVVVSPAFLRDPKELRRALGLTTELAFELEVDKGGTVRHRPDWPDRPSELAELARGLGVSELVVSPRGDTVDWPLVQELARSGSVWVDGTLEQKEASQLAASGAVGGMFHLNDELKRFSEEGPPP